MPDNVPDKILAFNLLIILLTCTNYYYKVTAACKRINNLDGGLTWMILGNLISTISLFHKFVSQSTDKNCPVCFSIL